MAYGQAQAFAGRKGDSKFGQGDPRGVIAPSAASNGIESGALIPTLLFGVPGAAPFALLLGILLIFGVQPGPTMITQELDLVYFIVWSFALASVAGAVLAFFMARPLAKLSHVRFPILAAGLIPILFMSGFQEPLNLYVFYTMFLLGIVGWVCKITNIPRAPFLIAYVLAEPLERYYFLTVNVFSPGEWLTRPFVAVIALVLIGVVSMSLLRYLRTRRSKDPAMQMSELSDLKSLPFMDLAVSLCAIVFFAVMLSLVGGFSENGRVFPLTVGILGVLLSIMSLVKDGMRIKAEGGLGRLDDAWKERLSVVGRSALWLLGFIALVFVFGMMVGSVIFAFVFLLVVARMKILPTVIYVACLAAALYALAEFAMLVPPTGYLL